MKISDSPLAILTFFFSLPGLFVSILLMKFRRFFLYEKLESKSTFFLSFLTSNFLPWTVVSSTVGVLIPTMLNLVDFLIDSNLLFLSCSLSKGMD